jgi:type II secretory pathway pseudopilin PulG
MGRATVKLVIIVAVVSTALLTTAVLTSAQGGRATEQAEAQAQNALAVAEQAVDHTRSALNNVKQ